MAEMTTIEVNGVKLEIDLRHARRIDTFKVGDAVKVLVKEYQGYKSHAGAIVGFDAFEKRPTIIVAYMEMSYSEAKIKYTYINSETEEVEIVAANPHDIPIEKDRVIDLLEADIEKKRRELETAQSHLTHFNKWFGTYFDQQKGA